MMIWKPATIALSVALAISGGLYWVKDNRLTRVTEKNVQLSGEVNRLTEANAIFIDKLAKVGKVNQTTNKTSREISKVVSNDKEIADFMAIPIPDGLRDVLKAANQ